MTSNETPLRVYWRPGCPACSSLRMAMNEAGVDATWQNIYEDPSAAAFVRSVAGGNETVPTVSYGGEALVAPRPRRLLRSLRQDHPELVTRAGRSWLPLRVLQWVGVVALVILSEVLARSGRSALSWGVDGIALAWFLVVRWFRLRPPGGKAR